MSFMEGNSRVTCNKKNHLLSFFSMTIAIEPAVKGPVIDESSGSAQCKMTH